MHHVRAASQRGASKHRTLHSAHRRRTRREPQHHTETSVLERPASAQSSHVKRPWTTQRVPKHLTLCVHGAPRDHTMSVHGVPASDKQSHIVFMERPASAVASTLTAHGAAQRAPNQRTTSVAEAPCERPGIAQQACMERASEIERPRSAAGSPARDQPAHVDVSRGTQRDPKKRTLCAHGDSQRAPKHRTMSVQPAPKHQKPCVQEAPASARASYNVRARSTERAPQHQANVRATSTERATGNRTICVP
jgi:hypothetical protein